MGAPARAAVRRRPRSGKRVSRANADKEAAINKYFRRGCRNPPARRAFTWPRCQADEIAVISLAARRGRPKYDTPLEKKDVRSGTSVFGENARFPYDDGLVHRRFDRRPEAGGCGFYIGGGKRRHSE